MTSIRSRAEATLSRRFTVPELYRMAGSLAVTLTNDRDYQDDLIQVGVIAASLALRKSGGEMPSAFVFRRMLRDMTNQRKKDRLDPKRKSFSPTIFLADLTGAIGVDYDPADSFEADRLTDGIVAGALSRMTSPEAALVLEVVTQNVRPAEASRRLGIREQAAQALYRSGVDRARKSLACAA